MDAIKVLFLFGGTPHYYNAILNRIHHLPGYHVTVVSPTDRNKLYGAGVHESTDDIQFCHVRLPETETGHHTFAFQGLAQVLSDSRPQIVVTVMHYLRQLVDDPAVQQAIRKNKIKIIVKDHPFGLKTYSESKRNYGLFFDPKSTRIVRQMVRWKVPRFLTLAFTRMAIARRRRKHRQRIESESKTLEQRRELYQRPDAYVCYIRQAYRIFGSYGVPRSRIFITGNSPDTEKWFKAEIAVLKSKQPVEKHPYRIVHIGRLVQWKRVDLLIIALQKLLPEFPNAELLVVGYGPQQRAWHELASRLGVQDRVTFTGGVYDSMEVARHLMSSSVYVLAGMGGLSINDAMCFRLPVICSVCDGTEKDLVFEGQNGHYFRPGDADNLADKIAMLFRNPEKLKSMGARSREIVEHDVNEKTVIQGYQRAFRYVLDS